MAIYSRGYIDGFINTEFIKLLKSKNEHKILVGCYFYSGMGEVKNAPPSDIFALLVKHLNEGSK